MPAESLPWKQIPYVAVPGMFAPLIAVCTIVPPAAPPHDSRAICDGRLLPDASADQVVPTARLIVELMR